MSTVQTVIATPSGWMIQCKACGWHEFPKRPLANGAKWSFNGDLVAPTFAPSMNQLVNGPGEHHNRDVPTRRCHFIVTDGQIAYCGDCTHGLKGQTVPLEPWPQEKIGYYAALLAHKETNP